MGHLQTLPMQSFFMEYNHCPGDSFGNFLIGSLTTILGFILAILWDLYKHRRDNKRKDFAVILAINEELLANIFNCESNKNAIIQELEALIGQKVLVSPISLLEDSAWDLIKINLPEPIVKDNSLLKKLRSLVQLIKHTNETIRSREIYRINNSAMTNFESRLRIYDNLILKRTEDLLDRLEILVEDVQGIIQSSKI